MTKTHPSISKTHNITSKTQSALIETLITMTKTHLSISKTHNAIGKPQAALIETLLTMTKPQSRSNDVAPYIKVLKFSYPELTLSTV